MDSLCRVLIWRLCLSVSQFHERKPDYRDNYFHVFWPHWNNVDQQNSSLPCDAGNEEVPFKWNSATVYGMFPGITVASTYKNRFNSIQLCHCQDMTIKCCCKIIQWTMYFDWYNVTVWKLNRSWHKEYSSLEGHSRPAAKVSQSPYRLVCHLSNYSRHWARFHF